ncbi:MULTISPECIES: MFS transporter [unclassified Corynebacterium]|uniref:MFS transporter n=1 Tax=unclassified Corynebacterium TaxID=2624378 RepID=UPI0029CA089E|nr:MULTISPECIES: MFS transporter [unclassified Corynebacterium]WPF65405.1 MFS transporter [Corynebacterium sp. 22KM0430]WPF67900.1 MFS transporter [Corynebacterium sp. 21KM1197]
MSKARSVPNPYPVLAVLALGGFAIGCLEFITLGLLPEIAQDLVPGLYEESTEAALARAGYLATSYALGVVLGTVTVSMWANRWERRTALVGLLLVISLAAVATAFLPHIELVLAARFLSGLPHGAYFGVASVVAAEVMGPGRRSAGISLVLSGLTLATLAGVPGATALGQAIGWRNAVALVGILLVVTAALALIVVPRQAGNPNFSVRSEFAHLKNGLVWVTLAISAIGFGALFAIYTYASTFTTEVAGLSAPAVPWALATLGVGMFVGNLLGGFIADKSVPVAMYGGFGAVICALLVMLLVASNPVGLFVSFFLVGAAAMSLSPTTQTRMVDVMPQGQALAGSLNQGAINMGNSMGALLGGAAVSAGLGYTSPAWVGVALAIAGGLMATASFSLEKKTRRRS